MNQLQSEDTYIAIYTVSSAKFNNELLCTVTIYPWYLDKMVRMTAAITEYFIPYYPGQDIRIAPIAIISTNSGEVFYFPCVFNISANDCIYWTQKDACAILI